MSDRIRTILERLDQTREDLLALSDDIWLSIDHNDSAALEEGVAFKKAYNAKLSAFDQLAGELSTLVQQFTAVKLDPTDAAPLPTPQATERVIRDLDQRQAYGLESDFTYKRPYGYQLGDAAQANVRTWRQLFEIICRHLARLDPERFARLPDMPDFTTRRGNPNFSRDPLVLRSAMALPSGIYAEINLSANHLRDQIKALLDTFGIERQSLRIYLRQDRDADSGE